MIIAYNDDFYNSHFETEFTHDSAYIFCPWSMLMTCTSIFNLHLLPKYNSIQHPECYILHLERNNLKIEQSTVPPFCPIFTWIGKLRSIMWIQSTQISKLQLSAAPDCESRCWTMLNLGNPSWNQQRSRPVCILSGVRGFCAVSISRSAVVRCGEKIGRTCGIMGIFTIEIHHFNGF